MSGWTLPGRFGVETWHRDNNRFVLADVGGESVAVPADAALLERIGARDTLCIHPGPMPGGFRFCPDCGMALGAAVPPDRSPPWSPPFGAADGLPEADMRGQPDPGSHQEIVVPASAALGFVVAGTPSRLLCCDRINGWISAFSSRDRDWHRLLQAPACPALPRWSWSAAATADGLALPTERGPAWIGLSGAVRVELGLPDQDCTAAGGVTRIGAMMLAPVMREGELSLAAFTDGRWTVQPVHGAVPAPVTPFACPVSTSDAVFWCGPTGQLVVRAHADGLDARFLPWTDAVSPLPDARPVVGRDGTLHALCRLDDATLVHEALALPGTPRGRRIARGYAPGTGRAVFRENTRLRLPWDERAACDYPLGDDRFLLPLFRLGEDRFLLAVCNDRQRLGRFLGDPLAATTVDAPPVSCTLMYSRGPRMLDPLDCVLRADRASDLSVLLHGNHLLVHGAVENRLHRWTLRDAD